MDVHIVNTKEEYLKATHNDNFCDKKVLFVWPDTNEYSQSKNGMCKRCFKQPCVGRMSVRKDITTQYGMGVCRECFNKE